MKDPEYPGGVNFGVIADLVPILCDVWLSMMIFHLGQQPRWNVIALNVGPHPVIRDRRKQVMVVG